MYTFPKRDQKGQVAVAILLIMTVMLTVAVSMAVRTTQEISNSAQQTESAQVFNAAESGIEAALQEGIFDGDPQGPSTFEPQPEKTQVFYSINPVSNVSSNLKVGQSLTISLENNSTPVIHWATEEATTARAGLLIAVYYTSGLDTNVEYFAVGAGRSDSFIAPNSPGDDDYKYRYQVELTPNAKLMRIIPVYADTKLIVKGNLPVQQHVIRSEATPLDRGVNFEKRTVEVTRTAPAPPTILDFGVYAKGSIIKN